MQINNAGLIKQKFVTANNGNIILKCTKTILPHHSFQQIHLLPIHPNSLLEIFHQQPVIFAFLVDYMKPQKIFSFWALSILNPLVS